MSTSIFLPEPDRNCTNCNGDGFVIQSKKDIARAVVCDCVPNCTRCAGSGIIHIETKEGTRSGRCLCQKLTDRIRIFNTAQIPSQHAENSFGNFSHHPEGASQAVALCQAWISAFKKGTETRGLILTGKVGRGKTHLMTSIVRNLIINEGKQIKFIEFSRLLAQLKEGYGKGASDSERLNQLSLVPILVIDELGKGRLTSWELSIIDEVVSRRYNAGLPILGTTNYKWGAPSGAGTSNVAAKEFDEQTLGDRVGGRVFSRLQETCIFYQLKGNDFRSQISNNLGDVF